MKTRPFLKWAGNKYHCLDHLLRTFPEASRLIEPFAGSAAVFMNTHYASYLLAEDNADLIALYQYIQQEGIKFIHYCRRWFLESNNTPEVYYHYRNEFNTLKKSRKRAALFLYLNRHGYNGLCRYNAKGFYNVPFGRYRKPYFPYQEMLFFYQKSQSAVFIHKDFRKTFLMAKEGDVIYCDPPYAPLKQHSNFTMYTGKKFGDTEQKILAVCAREAAKRGIFVLISNHDTEFTREQYDNAEITSFPVRRMINCKSSQRMPVKEILAIFRP
ncbi:MAG TPA: Dam family site-specific DNA-(adenine-N6)-methyltransferase [Legionellaceae bacterium]|nr:Dam family site-specific DNA-(adenine-N6)-methyltransferase [Legionellaceae bacterium]